MVLTNLQNDRAVRLTWILPAARRAARSSLRAAMPRKAAWMVTADAVSLVPRAPYSNIAKLLPHSFTGIAAFGKMPQLHSLHKIRLSTGRSKQSVHAGFEVWKWFMQQTSLLLEWLKTF